MDRDDDLNHMADAVPPPYTVGIYGTLPDHYNLLCKLLHYSAYSLHFSINTDWLH